MQLDDIAQLRLFALEHASEGTRALAKRYKSMPQILWGLTLQQDEQLAQYGLREGSSPTDVLSHRLLRLTHIHPDGIRYGENTHQWTTETDKQAQAATDYALKHQRETETQMLEVTRKLCALTNQPEPEWVKALHVQPLTTDTAQATKSVTHKLLNRTHVLRAEIVKTKNKAIDPESTASVWAELTNMADKKEGALIGHTHEGCFTKAKNSNKQAILTCSLAKV